MYEFWAEGSVLNVVLSAKRSNQILVVLVEGKDDISLKVGNYFNDNFRNNRNFIGLRVSEDSESYRHLTNIYSKIDMFTESNNSVRLKSPGVLFIGALGLPLAVIQLTNFTDLQAFHDRLDCIFKKFNGISATQAINVVYDQPNNEDKCGFLMKAYKIASEMISQKGKQDSSDLYQVKQEMKGEDQICEERASVDSCQNEEKTGRDPQQTHSIENVSSSSVTERISDENILQRRAVCPQETKILFRLNNGKMFSKTFSVTTHFKQVRQYVREQIGIKLFDLSFMSRCKEEEDDLTLKQLNMVPSAVLLVIPIGCGENSLLKKGFSRLTELFWFFAMPVIFCLRYVNTFLFGGVPGAQNRTESSSTSDSHQPPPPPPSGGFGLQQPPSQSRSNKKYGGSNIHTLRSLSDDNSQNNTYNGNSTQQMP